MVPDDTESMQDSGSYMEWSLRPEARRVSAFVMRRYEAVRPYLLAIC